MKQKKYPQLLSATNSFAKVIALVILFNWISLTSRAQQEVMFAKENSSPTGSHAFNLPLRVTCTFHNGTKKTLILEQVHGDSLIFEKYYNQHNYDCKWSDIRRIKIRHDREGGLYFGTTILTAATITLLIIYAETPARATDPGDTMSPVVHIFAPIFAGTTAIAALTLLQHFPEKFKSEKWRIHAK